jgi:hypothetical protein
LKIADCYSYSPQENSKTGKLHIVYLAELAVILFHELLMLIDTCEWLLPGRDTQT